MSSEPIPSSLGRYQVAEELGRGAMGVVYLAVDPVLARPVAIKVVKESEYMTPGEVEQYHARFRHEAEAAGRLSHPDIVQIFDVGPNYLVMEFIEGRPLSEALRGGLEMSVREVVSLVERVADAVDYAHRSGIVHRDVKPANVMLLEGGGVKVMDFGVARLDTSTLTAAGTVVGSVRYMAPEQMLGEKVDGRADVFSLAAVAYELLTAQPPFPGKTITEVVSRVVRGGHVPLSAAEPRLPAALDAVFAKAFAARVGDRYPRATEFAKELAAVSLPAAELRIRHRAVAQTPTEVDATADETLETLAAATDNAAEAAALAASPLPQPGAADATIVMGSSPVAPAATGAADKTILMTASPVVPPSEPPPHAEPPRPLTAQTIIMDITPPHREGVLLVDAEPAGTEVWVDGVKVGEAPLPDLEVKFGSHRLKLRAAGREEMTLDFSVGPDKPLRALSVALPPVRPGDGSVRPGQHVAFGPEVAPPRRVAGRPPAYPEEARKKGLEGAPVVEIWIGERGDVIEVALVESAGRLLDAALLEAVSGWRFSPARVRGVPVSVRMTVQHHFRL
jgi:serine/threonine-protein kinase